MFAALFMRYRQRWFVPGWSGNGYVEWVHATVAAGTAIAPNQYRPLVPLITRWLDQVTPANLPQAILAVDAVLLAAVVVMLVALGRRFSAPWLPLAGAAGYGLWFAKLDHWHPEVMLLTAIVGAVALEVSRTRPRWWVLGLLGLLAVGARTDYAATLGAAVLLLGLVRRSWPLALAGGAVVAVSAWATEWFVELYPNAQYRVPVVMIWNNLATPSSWVFVLGLYVLPMLVVPAVLVWQRRVLPPLWPVLVWFCAQFAATFVVGLVEESRIFLPFAAVLAAAAALAYWDLTTQPIRPYR